MSINSGESFLSFQLYVGVPHGIVGPFSAYIQVFSSANFNPVCAGGSQTDFTLPHHSPSFLTDRSGCLVTTPSLLHPGYASILRAISVQQPQAASSPSPSRATSFLRAPLHPPLLTCISLGSCRAAMRVPPWAVVAISTSQETSLYLSTPQQFIKNPHNLLLLPCVHAGVGAHPLAPDLVVCSCLLCWKCLLSLYCSGLCCYRQ